MQVTDGAYDVIPLSGSQLPTHVLGMRRAYQIGRKRPRKQQRPNNFALR